MRTVIADNLLQVIRSEDLVYDQIGQLTVLGDFERNIVNTLKQSGAHLLQGSRGVGKSMLLRRAEYEMDHELKASGILAVYVNFKAGTLLEGVKADQRDAFKIWVGMKIIQALYDKLIFLGLVGHKGAVDPYYRVFNINPEKNVQHMLGEKVHQLQNLAMSSNKDETISLIGKDFLARISDMSAVQDFIREVIGTFALKKIVFLFDEAAHTFIPSQQETFFEIFKFIHGGEVAVKAAVYPTVTSYGRNFEIGHDAIAIQMDRFETGSVGRNTNRKLFRDMLEKRLPRKSALRKTIFSKGNILDQCIDLSTGNPRAFILLLNKTIAKGYNDRAILLATQEYVDSTLLPYHTELTKRIPTYAHHVRVGLDLLRGYIIQEIRTKNYREKKSKYQSAYFTIQRDMSPNLKLAIDILCYSGLLTSQGTVKIAVRNTGLRYMVNLALLSAEKAFTSTNIGETIKSLSMTDYREFSANDPQIEGYLKTLNESTDRCIKCMADIPPHAKFCMECGNKVESRSIISGLLEEPIDNVSLSTKLIRRVKPHYPKVGSVLQATLDDLMTIKWIGPKRSRMIKNAAEEFISG